MLGRKGIAMLGPLLCTNVLDPPSVGQNLEEGSGAEVRQTPGGGVLPLPWRNTASQVTYASGASFVNANAVVPTS